MNHRYLQPILLVIITGLFYFPVTTFDTFHLDDPLHFERNKEMHEGTLENFVSLWTEPRNAAYTPFTYTLWFLQARLAKKPGISNPEKMFNPRVFRTTNYLFHIICSVIVYFLLLGLVKHRWAAFLGASFFSLHPLHVESVATSVFSDD